MLLAYGTAASSMRRPSVSFRSGSHAGHDLNPIYDSRASMPRCSSSRVHHAMVVCVIERVGHLDRELQRRAYGYLVITVEQVRSAVDNYTICCALQPIGARHLNKHRLPAANACVVRGGQPVLR